ncbi:Protein of unknown function [Friedmanniella luteola]|uniref:DUF3048 domain-containing protein n=1 Tax=Friedmanniella luteola TaxID=546871 RepID=A0A1H1VTB9_9ACTN|nr:Protein of unknown function [Friedmanniella luteola]
MVVASGLGAALVVGALGLLAVQDRGAPTRVAPTAAATSGAATPSAAPTPRRTPRPRPVDPLTGRQPVEAGVLAVKVENIAAAWPQLGLSAADVVVVEEVEGAQTRLVALYHSAFPRRVGPVRSARSTDVQLLPAFGRTALVYSGANARVQAKIDDAPILALQRDDRDPARVAPHDVVVDLRALARTTELDPPRSPGWTFDADAAVWDDAARARSAAVRIGADRFDFDHRDGHYGVTWNGRRYRDGGTGSVEAENVVVLDVENTPDGNRDVLGAASVLSSTVGRGKVTVHRDGRTLTGTWQRSRRSAPLSLRDRDGDALPLRPGRTWVLLRG